MSFLNSLYIQIPATLGYLFFIPLLLVIYNVPHHKELSFISALVGAWHAYEVYKRRQKEKEFDK